MNNDKIKQLREAYFEGKLSKQDEKWLIENSDDAYFNTMKSVKKEEMDWSFEEFLSTTEEAKKASVFKPTIYYWAVAASIALIVFSAFLFMNSGKEINPQQAKLGTPKEQSKQDIKETPKIIKQPIEQPKQVKTNKINQKRTPIPDETAYNPEYVVINGKPIYDLEEAKELTMNSLNLLASNVEKSVSSMESVKHLSVKF